MILSGLFSMGVLWRVQMADGVVLSRKECRPSKRKASVRVILANKRGDFFKAYSLSKLVKQAFGILPAYGRKIGNTYLKSTNLKPVYNFTGEFIPTAPCQNLDGLIAGLLVFLDL